MRLASHSVRYTTLTIFTKPKNIGLKNVNDRPKQELFCKFASCLIKNDCVWQRRKCHRSPADRGGAMMEFLSKNIKYPVVAEENGIKGRVLVKIVVKKDGTIDSPTVVKGVDPSLNKEAIRVVKTMPKWIPGKQKGEPVNVSFTVPVTFRI